LIGTYLSIPSIAGKALSSINANLNANSNGGALPSDGQAFYCAMGMLVFGLSAISFACLLLGRSAFIELEMAARMNGLADALCLADGSLENFEKATKLLVPKGKYLTVPGIPSQKDGAAFVEILKLLRN
jgi:hypothetical protein